MLHRVAFYNGNAVKIACFLVTLQKVLEKYIL